MSNHESSTRTLEQFLRSQGESAQDLLRQWQDTNRQLQVTLQQNATLREVNRQLHSSRNHYSQIYQYAPVPYFVFDSSGKVVSMNQPASLLLSIPPKQYGFSFFSYLHELSRPLFEQHLRILFHEQKYHNCELRLYPNTPHPNPPTIHVALESIWMKHNDSSQGYCLSACIDVSGFKRLQNELEEARIHAEKASSLKSQFLANMSHEIRTPLSSVLGYVDLLRQDIDIPEQREKLEIAYRAGKHLLFLINEIIDLSKIEHDRLELRQAPFLPGALLDGIQDLFEIAAEENEILLEFTRQFLPHTLLGDAERIRQILVNIIGNAIKFTPRQGKVEVHVSYKVDILQIRIRDTGPGIPPEQLQAIFEMFHQADNSDTRTHGGSGLGLAISQKLVQLMDGSIELQSTLGKGSTFYVHIPLPIASDDDEDSDISGLLPAPFLADEASSIPRVLIVDDDRILQRLLGTFVGRMGYDFDIAAHGKDALDRLEEARYDLVLLDLQMPVMDGYETARQIRTQSRFKDLPVIALTAKAIQDDLNQCLAAGCDSYITKPVVYKKLAQQIHRYLRPIEAT